MTAAARLGAIAIVVVAACSIDHPTDELQCEDSGDCEGNRSCVGGYCVEGGGPQCPSACTSCDLAMMRCTIDRSGGGGGNAVCPDGWHCTITCGANACNNVDCSDAASCVVQCSGNNACNDVDCGSASCDVTCSGQRGCRDVDCRDSCSCDVTCTDANSCDNQAQCPDQACESGDGCSSQPASCATC